VALCSARIFAPLSGVRRSVVDYINVIGHRAGHITNQHNIFINFNYKYTTKTSKTSGFSSSARGLYLACH